MASTSLPLAGPAPTSRTKNVTPTTNGQTTNEGEGTDLAKYAEQALPGITFIDRGALVAEGKSEVDDLMAAYTAERDELLATPFAHNTLMAQLAIPFTILRTGERSLPDMNDPSVSRDKYVYLVRLQKGYTHTDEGTGQIDATFSEDDNVLIALDVNDVRRADRERIESFLEKYDSIPNCVLQQYPARKKGHSPSVGIVHASIWRPLSEMR